MVVCVYACIYLFMMRLGDIFKHANVDENWTLKVTTTRLKKLFTLSVYQCHMYLFICLKTFLTWLRFT